MKAMKVMKRSYSAKGMVSIMVTLIMMLVISIIVLGFAQISRREQRQSLDRQLSTQAFLAAESGVNDARKAMQEGLASTGSFPEKTSCDPGAPGPTNPYANYDPVIDDEYDVRYSCLLVDTTLDNIRQLVNADGSSVTVPLRPANPAERIRTVHIKWLGADDTAVNNNCPTSVGTIPASSNWPCDFGTLRVDMVPTDNLNRSTLLAEQRAFFLFPIRQTSGVPQLNYANARGALQQMHCINANGDCRVDITNVDTTKSSYALRLTGIYKPGSVIITAETAGGTPVVLKDAQAQVDVTGRAQDVLRRIQVRLSLGQVTSNADYPLQSGSSICKRFSVTNTDFENATDIKVNDSTNPMCN